MKIDEFIKEVKKLNIDINEDILNKLEIYTNFLKEYNKHTNLTAITTDEDIYLKHYYDSLCLTKVINLNKYQTLLDFGTGAGFPGMVLKIFFPSLHVTLLDSNNKKIKFLTELSKKLNVDNLELINTRVENLSKEKLNYYDIVTARAVTNMPVLTELAMPLVKKDGYFIALKGSNLEEITKSSKVINIMHGKVEEINSFVLSDKAGARNIVKIRKLQETTPKEIRSYEKIIKNPIAK